MKSLNLLSTSALLLMFSFDRAREFRNLSCKPSLLNYHQLSCNSCSRLTGAWELRKLSCKLSLLNYHQLSCTSCSPLALFLTRARENSHANSRFSTIINSHATLVLVWPGHESWENSHANSRFSTINYHATLVLLWLCLWPGQEKTLVETLASQLSSTLMQLLFSFDRGMRIEKTLMQTLASQLSSTLMQLLFSFGIVFDQGKRKLSCKLSLLNSHQLSCNSCSSLSLTRARENSHANSRFSTLVLFDRGFNGSRSSVLLFSGQCF
jgi:hypothetical protein